MGTSGERRLGVSWVLRQAAVIAVMAAAAVHVCGVTALTLSQRQIAKAAHMAAAEARLPKASLKSIQGQAHRVLSNWLAGASIELSIYRKSNANVSTGRLQSGDRVVVKIAAPARPMMPDLLARLAPWLACEKIVAEAGAVVP